MPYTPYEMNDDSPDLRSPELRDAQRAEFHDTMARARTLQTRERAEGWTEERRWGERLPDVRKGRQWTSAAELSDYLASEWTYWNGRAPSEQDRKKIDRTAQAMWTSREVERLPTAHQRLSDAHAAMLTELNAVRAKHEPALAILRHQCVVLMRAQRREGR